MKIKLLFFVVFLFATISSFAHQPILNSDGEMSPNKPYIIEDPEISKAIYSTLEGAAHYYVISSDKPFNFYAGLSDVEAIDDDNSGIHLSLGSSVNYKLPIEKCDLSLYLSLTQTTDGEDTYGLYSTGLTYGKTLSCSK